MAGDLLVFGSSRSFGWWGGRTASIASLRTGAAVPGQDMDCG